jgi:hypothetical protein
MTTPRVYLKLRAEIKTAVDEGKVSSTIQMDEALNLPYLQAVIYEGLRSKYSPEFIGFILLAHPPFTSDGGGSRVM